MSDNNQGNINKPEKPEVSKPQPPKPVYIKEDNRPGKESRDR